MRKSDSVAMVAEFYQCHKRLWSLAAKEWRRSWITSILTRKRRSAIARYLAAHAVKKLHLGAGDNSIPAWLNSDAEPPNDEIILLDVTRPFPFSDESFNYIFTEHLIEHIPYRDALFMLKECFRILAPGGKIRIATPDLKKLVSLLSAEPGGNRSVKNYLEWAMAFNRVRPSPASPCRIFNRLMRGFGHQFIYDSATLVSALEGAGFKDMAFCDVGMSDDSQLRGIEGHWKLIGEESNRFETMIVEAVKTHR